MGQNIGTGGRAWGKILGPCEEYTGVHVSYATLQIVSCVFKVGAGMLVKKESLKDINIAPISIL